MDLKLANKVLLLPEQVKELDLLSFENLSRKGQESSQ